jgi:ABC-type transport system involved in multi-copper enzyme maturation permease subunit
MNWALWARQTLVVMRIELQRSLLGRRWLGAYAAAAAPVVLLGIAGVYGRLEPGTVISDMTTGFAVFYQTYLLRLAIFFCSALVFSQLFRGEVLEKTVHFYLLTPVRREILMLGKYLAGVVTTGTVFGLSTVAAHLLVYLPYPVGQPFFADGDGIGNTARYLAVSVLACATYGALFLLVGLLFKNPIGPAIAIAGWEAFFFVLPATVQKFTIMHYLQSMLPVGIDMGPFAVVVDRTPAVWGIPILLGVGAAAVWLSGQVMRFAEVTYGAD